LKRKDFRVIKTEEQFLRNYKLHDKAEFIGNKILNYYGFDTVPFGEDRRHEEVWEAGEDRPDCFVIKKNDGAKKNLCMLDWKAKRSAVYRINERAYRSYNNLIEKLKLKLIIAIAVFQKETILSFKYFVLPDRELIRKRKKEWDGNYSVVFNSDKALDFRSVDKLLNEL
jgi:hypothetical protein